MDRGTVGKVRDGSRDRRGGPGQVRGPYRGLVTDRVDYGKFGKGWGTLGEVRDGLGDPQGGPGRVVGHRGGLGRVEGI